MPGRARSTSRRPGIADQRSTGAAGLPGHPPHARLGADQKNAGHHRRGARHGRDSDLELADWRARSRAAAGRLRRRLPPFRARVARRRRRAFSATALVVQLRRSKTDQEAVGRKVGLPFGSNPLTCPVRALRDWLERGGIVRGPIFRPIDRHGNVKPQRLTDQSVALVVKRCAKAAGLDSEKYAGHSLRSGLATAAAMADVSERAIMAQTGHKSLPSGPPLHPRRFALPTQCRRGGRGTLSRGHSRIGVEWRASRPRDCN